MANQYTAYTFISGAHKYCSLCKEIKLHSEFHKDKKNIRSKGLAYYCKVCAITKAQAFHKANSHTDEFKRIKKAAYTKHRYGITLEEYEEKLVQQQNQCSICGIGLQNTGPLTHLDHCHSSGKLRDFLCTNCNRGLGSFMDNTMFLQNAIDYLNRHNQDGQE